MGSVNYPSVNTFLAFPFQFTQPKVLYQSTDLFFIKALDFETDLIKIYLNATLKHHIHSNKYLRDQRLLTLGFYFDGSYD